MSEMHINPRYLFPAPGWRCFQCSIFDDKTAEFWEQPVLGWGVVEGKGCLDEGELHLLVALQEGGSVSKPTIYHSEELYFGDVLDNSSFGFCFDSELSENDKKTLEQEARRKLKTKCCVK